MKINKPNTFYTVPIPKLHGLLTRSYTLCQLTPEDSPGTLSTVSIGWKRKLVMSRPPILTLPSWSSNASHMFISSRKMLKRVGESRHPCRTPTVVLSQSPLLPLNRTALWALSYRLSMTRMMLALMLYFLILPHKASWRSYQHSHSPLHSFLFFFFFFFFFFFSYTKFVLYPQNEEMLYMLLYIGGAKILKKKKWKCTPNYKMQWEPCMPYPVKGHLEGYEDIERFCWCCTYLSQRILRLNICSLVLLLPALKPACSDLFCLWLESV